MTIFENIKTKNMDEFVEWLYSNFDIDSAPWVNWFDNNYCSKCDHITAYIKDYQRDMNFAWCEIYEKCKFFPELDGSPDSKQVIKMWLESECKNE